MIEQSFLQTSCGTEVELGDNKDLPQLARLHMLT
jgi:hypothetical protein